MQSGNRRACIALAAPRNTRQQKSEPSYGHMLEARASCIRGRREAPYGITRLQLSWTCRAPCPVQPMGRLTAVSDAKWRNYAKTAGWERFHATIAHVSLPSEYVDIVSNPMRS